MLQNAKRIYALQGWTVEKRTKGWYFARTYGEAKFKGPYGSAMSVCLMIARELLKELSRRDLPYSLD
jgi:hypothetical protein